MPITPKNLVKHELIGLEARVVDSANIYDIGASGRIVDETRNTLVMETKKGEKTLIKDQCIFSFKIPAGWVRIEGKILVARPEDRIKKKLKKW